MYEPTLSVTVPLQSAQRRSADISLIRAALFGATAPPLLGTAAFLLLMKENWIGLPSPFFLLFMFLTDVRVCRDCLCAVRRVFRRSLWNAREGVVTTRS